MSSGRIPSVEGGIQPTIVDAKGDLIVATAADTVSRLAVGTNGYTLVADSSEATGLKWASPSSSVEEWVSIGTTNTTSGSTITISSLGTYNKIRILFQAVSQDGVAELNVRFNSDTGSNYYWSYGGGTNTSDAYPNTRIVPDGFYNSQTSINVFYNGTNNSTVSGFLEIDGCKATTNPKTGFFLTGSGDANGWQRYGGFVYSGTSAITSISLIAAAGNFDDGLVKLYGSAV